MHDLREILLCNVKCLRRKWIYFISLDAASNFTMTEGHYFISEGYFTLTFLNIILYNYFGMHCKLDLPKNESGFIFLKIGVLL